MIWRFEGDGATFIEGDLAPSAFGPVRCTPSLSRNETVTQSG